MVAKQVVIDKDTTGKVVSVTVHYHDRTAPDIFLYSPPLDVPHILQPITLAASHRKTNASSRNKSISQRARNRGSNRSQRRRKR
jgi:hypothetical protein